jgi:Voltage-dependent anion channel
MSSDLNRGREIIRQFTPNWFTATMGTGILALALNQFPLHISGLPAIARGLWLLNIMLFLLFSVLYLVRWTGHYQGARRIEILQPTLRKSAKDGAPDRYGWVKYWVGQPARVISSRDVAVFPGTKVSAS